jgi:hypothetical protein
MSIFAFHSPRLLRLRGDLSERRALPCHYPPVRSALILASGSLGGLAFYFRLSFAKFGKLMFV